MQVYCLLVAKICRSKSYISKYDVSRTDCIKYYRKQKRRSHAEIKTIFN